MQVNELSDHFFRNEYGKMVAIVAKYLGSSKIETAEDIVQETLLKATKSWQLNGVPADPKGWLYETAKNQTLNIIKRNKKHNELNLRLPKSDQLFENFELDLSSEERLSDEQLRMMFLCCHTSLSEDVQITLILKILCGFSIKEIASAYFTSYETINKRLTRGRKALRLNGPDRSHKSQIKEKLSVVLRTIYLLFNEGYKSSSKNQIIRNDLCFEAIRLSHLLINSALVKDKSDVHALLALMYLNVARFESRSNDALAIVEMQNQDRSTWNPALINEGVAQLDMALQYNSISKYIILATISAVHCAAPSYDKTNWNSILEQYDNLLKIEDSPLVRLNRSIALAKVKGNSKAIKEILLLGANPQMANFHLYHATLGEFYQEEQQPTKAKHCFEKAIELAANSSEIDHLKRKVRNLVPV